MKHLFRMSIAALVGILFLFTGMASAQGLNIDENYHLISKQRVSRTEYNYTYQADITNTGSDVQNVTATLTSNSPHTTVVDGAISFGDVSSGATVTSMDTFTIRQDRRYPLDSSSLIWDIQYEQIVGPSGGTFEGESGVAVTVPPGATDQTVPISIEPVQEDELGKDVPAGCTFVGATALDIGDVVLNDNADITIPCPSGVPENAEIYVAKVVEYAGTQMFMMVDTATVQGDTITSQDPAFPGIMDSGTYCFLWAYNVGWIGGQVTYAASGDQVPGAVVTLSGGYWLNIADDNGYYDLPAWAGNFVVVAFDDQTGEHGEQQGYMPSSGVTVVANVQIGESSGPVQGALTNGDFETGDLTGWEVSGAGSVISSLGPISPYEGTYMAMISSGSGAVGGASSALEQSFTVPAGATTLTIHYNFVSEEYPEYVGSQFNDVFNATLHTPDGSREIAFEDVNSANFQPVSGIPCGSGDCTWGQTGWITASIDVSQWAGTDDTLTLTVHDVGDTIYDTVVLLDDISLNDIVGGQVVVIDGVHILSVLNPDYPADFSRYLEEAIDEYWSELIETKVGQITTFGWSRNIYDTSEYVLFLSVYLETLSTQNKKPLVILAHSWGTVLSYIAIARNSNIVVDKFITLGSPLNAQNETVRSYTQETLSGFNINQVASLPNVKSWCNYWAQCDPISGEISNAYNINIDTNFIDNALGICHAAYYSDYGVWQEILFNIYLTN